MKTLGNPFPDFYATAVQSTLQPHCGTFDWAMTPNRCLSPTTHLVILSLPAPIVGLIEGGSAG